MCWDCNSLAKALFATTKAWIGAEVQDRGEPEAVVPEAVVQIWAGWWAYPRSIPLAEASFAITDATACTIGWFQVLPCKQGIGKFVPMNQSSTTNVGGSVPVVTH